MVSSPSTATVCAQVLGNTLLADHYNHLRYLILEMLASTYNVDKPTLRNALNWAPRDEVSLLPDDLQTHLDQLSSLVADTRRKQNLQEYGSVAPQTWASLYALIIKPSYEIDDGMSNLLDLFEHYARNRDDLARRYRPTPFTWYAPSTWFGILNQRVAAKCLVSDEHVVMCIIHDDGVRNVFREAINRAGLEHLHDWDLSRSLYRGFYTTDDARDLWRDIERVAGKLRMDVRRRGMEILRATVRNMEGEGGF
ncbi:hypothetical protein PTMSG1_03556 [Pyrenophora teres f. maculata]|nr:hypothetical protein PTMSG1_03556 [Pyrenophora teres f. maculata]